jgi:hypothetical protein
MSKSADQSAEAIYEAALKLSDDERELLLLKLTAPVSSDEFATPELRAAWAVECDRRYQDWQAGNLQAVPGDLVMQRLLQRRSK